MHIRDTGPGAWGVRFTLYMRLDMRDLIMLKVTFWPSLPTDDDLSTACVARQGSILRLWVITDLLTY